MIIGCLCGGVVEVAVFGVVSLVALLTSLWNKKRAKKCCDHNCEVKNA